MKDLVTIAVLVTAVIWSVVVRADDYYSSYYGELLTSDEVAEYTSNGTLANCTNVVATCDSTEGRRIDGTCNNLNYPSKGATRTPYSRVLDPVYYRTSDTVFDPKLAEDGQELTAARVVRTRLIADGRIEDEVFTHCATHFSVFYATDITNTKDTTNYVSWRPFCCEEAGLSDPMCAPNPVPEDDYTHRFSGIRCLNMTRPLSFQTSGCLPTTSTPLRIVDATPVWDLSPVYGNVVETGRRTYVNGTLTVDTVNNRDYPPTSGVNLLLGVNFFGIIFFWRFHNHIAGKLQEVNPHWTDEQLFTKAREINIASGCQIFYYELMSSLMGYDNLVADGVLCEDNAQRSVYDETLTPQISLEFPVILRWMHKMQDGVLKFYDSEGTYLNKTFPMVNLTSNINYIKEGDNMDGITQGCVRQASGKVDDDVADPDIINLGLGGLQRSNDIMTNDLAKNRHSGFQGYIHYRSHYFGDNITTFDDLKGIVKSERIGALQDVYTNVEDIDLLAGVWMEILKDGAYVPPTFYAIVKDQLLHNMKSDRFWYENPDILTEGQLQQIRVMTGARMLCDIGDSITSLQPQIFKMACAGNEVVDCSEIPDMDYSAWAESE